MKPHRGGIRLSRGRRLKAPAALPAFPARADGGAPFPPGRFRACRRPVITSTSPAFVPCGSSPSSMAKKFFVLIRTDCVNTVETVDDDFFHFLFSPYGSAHAADRPFSVMTEIFPSAAEKTTAPSVSVRKISAPAVCSRCRTALRGSMLRSSPLEMTAYRG